MGAEKPKVLIIDDDEYIRDMIKIKLEASGFEVQEAKNGEVGIEVAKKFKPNVILLDMVMPVLGGLETLARLSRDKEAKKAKVFLFTGQGLCRPDLNEMCRRFAIEEGAVDYLRKEIDLDNLVKIIKDAITSK